MKEISTREALTNVIVGIVFIIVLFTIREYLYEITIINYSLLAGCIAGIFRCLLFSTVLVPRAVRAIFAAVYRRKHNHRSFVFCCASLTCHIVRRYDVTEIECRLEEGILGGGGGALLSQIL